MLTDVMTKEMLLYSYPQNKRRSIYWQQYFQQQEREPRLPASQYAWIVERTGNCKRRKCIKSTAASIAVFGPTSPRKIARSKHHEPLRYMALVNAGVLVQLLSHEVAST